MGVGPLDGVRVVDLTTTFSGPYCTQALAEMGADVVKIESPAGDITRSLGTTRDAGMASVYVATNRNKASVVLDLKDADDRAVLDDLVRRADCLVHNMRPDAARRLGVDADTAAAANPRLVHAAITGYGSDGPYAGRPAYDDIIQATSGLAWLQGLGANEPSYVATAIADKLAGLTATQAIVSALYWRERTGRGQAIEVPMFETAVGFTLLEQWGGRAFVPPLGPTGYARMRSPYRRPYRTTDGLLAVVVYHGGHWARFLQEVGHAHLLQDERYRTVEARNHNIDDLYRLLEVLLSQRSTAEWLELFERIDVPAMPVRTLDELFDDEHLKAVEFFQEVEDRDGGRYLAGRHAVRFSASPTACPSDLPAADRLGAGTSALKRWAAEDSREDAFEEIVQGSADGGRWRHDRQGRSQPSGQAQGPARRASLTATTDEHGSRFAAEEGR